jgi:phosphatidylglycerophosphate synthase
MGYEPDGRKLPREYENPFDNYIIDIAHWCNVNIFRPLNFTPNMITTLSLLTGLICVWLMYTRYYLWAAVLLFVSYVLDCADGNFARFYKMVSPFGDIYDHVSDWTKILLVVILIYVRLEGNMQKYIFVALTIMMSVLCGVHMGCQEKIYAKAESSTLHITSYFCPYTSHIIYTRFVGCGTHIVFFIVYMMVLHFQM